MGPDLPNQHGDSVTRPRGGQLAVSAPVRIAAIYVVVALVWIFGSDWLIQTVFANVPNGASLAAKAQTLKGSFFVVMTGLMLWLLIRDHTVRLERLNDSVAMSEQRLRTLLTDIPIAVCLVRDGRFVYANAAARSMLGDAPSLEGRALADRVHPDSVPEIEGLLLRVQRESATIQLAGQRMLGARGEVIDAVIYARPSEVDGGTFELAIMDVTDRVRLEQVALRAQKQEAIGLIAAGVAHNFNNVLTAIMGQVRLARRTDPLPEETDKALNLIDELAMQAAAITRSLLSFARLSKPDRLVVGVARLLHSVEPLIRGIMPSFIGVHVDTSALGEDVSVLVDEGQIKQTILNLAINARDAVRTRPGGERGGELRIGATVGSADGGNRVRITVSDNGSGIPAEVLPKLFTPFFSTKPAGFGTGLGLPIAKSIMHDHDGDILVESVPNVGTTFTLVLPVASPEITRQMAPSTERAQGTVILGEENESVRRFVGAWLRGEGYDVVETGDYPSLLRLVDEHHRKQPDFLAVVLGENLPGLTTEDTAKGDSNGAEQRGIASVVITGEGNAYIPPELRVHAKLLSKPFGRRELIDAVRGLEAPRTGAGESSTRA